MMLHCPFTHAPNCPTTSLLKMVLVASAAPCYNALNLVSRREQRVADAPSKPNGVIVAMDDFESYPDGAELNGLNGGSGWGGPWVSR